MTMKVLILNGSARKGGNTDLLIEAFKKGIKNADVEVIRVSDYKVHPCVGCNSCLHNDSGRCVRHDDMMYFWEKFSKTDVLVIASPVYFYGISAQLKAVVDRLHAPARNDLPIKRTALLLVGASSKGNVFDAAKLQYECIVDFFGLENLGEVCVGNVKEIGDIKGNPALMLAEEAAGRI